jgi:hypothetical protein
MIPIKGILIMSRDDTNPGTLKDLLLHTSDKSLTFLLVSLAALLFVIYPFFAPRGFGQIFWMSSFPSS